MTEALPKGTKLPYAIRRTIEAMVHGIDRPYFPDTPREIPAGTPLPLRLAAVAVGCRLTGLSAPR